MITLFTLLQNRELRPEEMDGKFYFIAKESLGFHKNIKQYDFFQHWQQSDMFLSGKSAN